jgi:hypothetical protein
MIPKLFGRVHIIVGGGIIVGSGIIVGGGKKQPIVSTMVAIVRYRYMPGKGTLLVKTRCVYFCGKWRLSSNVSSMYTENVGSHSWKLINEGYGIRTVGSGKRLRNQ